eukprot:m.199035 g.199035  ORF g.199035 m.199035 type:complete len:124 (-) comp25904_c0_seq7:336-707(-)
MLSKVLYLSIFRAVRSLPSLCPLSLSRSLFGYVLESYISDIFHCLTKVHCFLKTASNQLRSFTVTFPVPLDILTFATSGKLASCSFCCSTSGAKFACASVWTKALCSVSSVTSMFPLSVANDT